MSYAIFSPMRAGSTFLFRMIRDFSNDYDSKLNDEYFNTVYPGWSVIDTGVELVNSDRKYLPLHKEIEYRISLLQKYNCKYTIKILSTHITQQVIDFVYKNYIPIVIDRENKYDQYLSYVIAFHTDVWNTGNNKERKIEKFICPTEYALNFFKIEQQWLHYKKHIIDLMNPIEMTYELLTNNPISYLESKGIQTQNFSKNYQGLYKMNIKNSKQDYIINIEELNDIYDQNKSIWD
jgi:hypothetical protein